MKHQRMHGLEKIQVELAAAAALAATYFWLAPAVAPPDPLAPVAFLPFGQTGALAKFVLGLCGLGALCGAVAISSRKEGALLAVLIGAGGASIRSPSIRPLLWGHEHHLGGLYFTLIQEVVLLWCGLAAASLVVNLVQGLLGRLCPGWAWKSPLTLIAQEQGARVAGAAREASDKAAPHAGVVGAGRGHPGSRGPSRPGAPGGARTPAKVVQALSSAGVGLVLSLVFLRLLLRTDDRMQILFALGGSFAAGTLIASQLFPTPYGIAAWGTPVLAAVFFYLVSAFAAVPQTPAGWTVLPPHAMPLPVDWLSAGGGGAVLGYWISCRLHELRLLEHDEKHTQPQEG